MRFKTALLIAILSGPFLMSGCSWIRDHRKAGMKLSTQTGALNLSCLKPISKDLQALFHGDMTDSPDDQDRVRGIWDCLDRALNVFSHYTQGSQPDSWEASELQSFANQFLGQDQEISDSFTLSIFELKAIVLGGSTERITLAEVVQLRKNLNLFGEAILPFAPRINTLLDLKNHDLTKIGVALYELNEFLVKLAAIFETSVRPMPWDTLSGFAMGLDHYIKAKDNTGLTMLYEQKDLIRYFKLFIFGGSDTEIEQSRWKSILVGLNSTVVTLLASRGASDTVEKIDLELSSTAEEQRRAIRELGNTLKTLLATPDLKTIERIRQIADYWIKGRVLFEILLPKSNTELSLNFLLTDPQLRKSENHFIETWLSDLRLTQDPRRLTQVISDLRALLGLFNQRVQQATGKRHSISISTLLQLAEDYQDFFLDHDLGENVLRGLRIFRNLHPLITHKTGDEIVLQDFDPILEKASQFLDAPIGISSSPQEKFEGVLRILRMRPSVDSISKKQLVALIPGLNTVLSQHLKTAFTLESLKALIDCGFDLKATLWNSNPDTLSLSDLENIASLLSLKEEFLKNPANTILAGNRKFAGSGFTPAIRISTLEKAMQSEPTFLRYLQLFKILRKTLVGSTEDMISLEELARIATQVRRYQDLTTELSSQNLVTLLGELIGTNPQLFIPSEELQTLLEAAKLKAFPLQRAIAIKHALLGTSASGIESKDLEIIKDLLSMKEKNSDALDAFFRVLEEKNALASSSIDLKELTTFFVQLKDAGFLEKHEKIITPMIDVMKAMGKISEAILGDGNSTYKLTDLKAVMTGPPLLRAQAGLDFILHRTKKTNFLQDDLISIVGTLTPYGIDPEKSTHLIKAAFSIKESLFNSKKGVLSVSELELISTALKIANGPGTTAKKSKQLEELISKGIHDPIDIRKLTPPLAQLLSALKLSSHFPLPLDIENLRRIKILTVGGNPNLIYPDELAALVRKVMAGGSPQSYVAIPHFGLNAKTFLWLESALGLAIESKKEMGLLDLYSAIQHYFDSNGHPLKYDLSQNLYGIWYHTLLGKKGPLPRAVLHPDIRLTNQDRVDTSHLRILYQVVHTIQTKLQDLENAYEGSDGQMPRSDLMNRLKDSEARAWIAQAVPILKTMDGKPTLFLSTAYATQGHFESSELAYRTVLREAVLFLFRNYNSSDSSPVLNVIDLAILLTDLRNLMLNFGLVYRAGSVFEVAPKKMRAINLFTRAGNGDNLLDVDETIEFLTMGYGLSPILDHLFHTLSSNCTQKESVGLAAFEGRCVVNTIFAPETYSNLYGRSIPSMITTFPRSNPRELNEFELSTLRMSGKKLYKEKDRNVFSSFSNRTLDDYTYSDFDLDILQGLNSVHSFVESIFESMDTNHNETIELTEALALFPKFCPALKAAAKEKISGSCDSPQSSKELLNLYGYLLVNQEIPGFSFLLWESKWKEYVSGERTFKPLNRHDVFKILSNMNP